MRRNRKVPKKMSVVATNTMRFGVIILVFFFMVILNVLSQSSCKQLQNANGRMEREIAKLEDSRTREATRWEGMKTPDKIEEALLRHGLSMKTPRADQTVRLMADGRPRPGQLSLAKAKMRTGVETMVSVRSPRVSGSRGQYRRRGSVR